MWVLIATVWQLVLVRGQDLDGDGLLDLTPKCDEREYKEYLRELVACYDEADNLYKEILAANELDFEAVRRGFCDQIEQKVSQIFSLVTSWSQLLSFS